MGYNTLIGDKRAKELAKQFISAAKEKSISLPALQKFVDEGLKADNIFQPIKELNEELKFPKPYDDVNRLRDYFLDCIPGKFQREVAEKNPGNFNADGTLKFSMGGKPLGSTGLFAKGGKSEPREGNPGDPMYVIHLIENGKEVTLVCYSKTERNDMLSEMKARGLKVTSQGTATFEEYKISKKFSEILHDWIGKDMLKVIETNKTPEYKDGNLCATHDYCDANMAMDEAFTSVMGRSFVFYNDEKPETEKQNEADTKIMNNAWLLAKKSDFYNGKFFSEGGKPLGSTGLFEEGGATLEKKYTIEDLKTAFNAGNEMIWEDLEQTSRITNYYSFDDWWKDNSFEMGGKPLGSTGLFEEGGDTNDDLLEFIIPIWALAGIVNGDYSGMENDEEGKLNKFLNKLSAQYGNAELMTIEDEESYFAHGNDIDKNMGGDVLKMVLRPSEGFSMGGKPLGSTGLFEHGGAVDLSAAKKYIEKGCALILEKSKLETKALAVRIPGNYVQKELIKKMNDISEEIKKLVDLNKSNLDFNQFVEAKLGYKKWYKSNVPIKMKEEAGSHRFNNTQYFLLEKEHGVLYPNDPIVRGSGRYAHGGLSAVKDDEEINIGDYVTDGGGRRGTVTGIKDGEITWHVDFEKSEQANKILETDMDKLTKLYSAGGKPLGSTGLFAKGGKIKIPKEDKVTMMIAIGILGQYSRTFKETQNGYVNTQREIKVWSENPYDNNSMAMAIINLKNYREDRVKEGKETSAIDHVLPKIEKMYKQHGSFSEGGKPLGSTGLFSAGASLGGDSPKIYVADLAAYNNGHLRGEWLDLSDYDDGKAVMEEIAKMMKKFTKEDRKKNKSADVVEEWAIHDTENIPSSISSEYMGIADFDKIISTTKVAGEMGIPIEALLDWMADQGKDTDPEQAKDAYQGEYDSESDYAYAMVEEGIVSADTANIYITDTDRRIIAGEESDNRYEDNDDEDELITDAEMQDELTELENKRDRKAEVEDELETAVSDLTDLEEEVSELESERDAIKPSKDKKGKKIPADQDAIDEINKKIDTKQEEVSDKKNTIDTLTTEQGELDDFDFDSEKTSLSEKAKEKLVSIAYDEIYDELKDPVQYFVEDQGIYTKEELVKQSFISIDYDDLAKTLGYDMNYYHVNGKVYIFSANYAKGGTVKNKEHDYTTIAEGNYVAINGEELSKIDGKDKKVKAYYKELMEHVDDVAQVKHVGMSLVKVSFPDGKSLVIPKKLIVRLSYKKGGRTVKK